MDVHVKQAPKDQMTPKERMRAYQNGETVDRLPIELMMSEDGSLHIGKTTSEYLFDSDVMLETESFKVKELGFESASVGLSLRGIGECLGSEFEYPNNRAPHVIKPILTDYSMLNQMDVLNPYKDGRAPIILEGISKLRDRFDDYCTIGGSVPGPISAAHAVRGEKQLLKDIIKEPENFELLLDFMVENALSFVEANFKMNGVVNSIADPMSSTVLIHPKTFEQKIYPYLKKLVDGINKITGGKPSLHICGESKGIWHLLKKLEIGAYSLDNIEDIGEARKVFGDELLIIGNIDPVSLLTYGSPEEIVEETKISLEKAGDSPCGYIPGTGCDISYNTPVENIKLYTDTVKILTQNYKKGSKR